MRLPVRQILLGAALAAFAGYGTASAQRVGVEVYPGAPYYTYSDENYYFYEPSPRSYGYTSEVVEPDVTLRVRPTNCGEFRYWNGERCADARIDPPDVR
jgi:hypothetical protein